MTEKFVIALIEKFDSASIAELVFDDGDNHLTLRKEAAFRGGTAAASSLAAQDAVQTAPALAAGASAILGLAPAPGGTSAGAPAADASHVRLGLPVGAANSGAAGPAASPGAETITSPIVATYYGSPSPDAPAFVQPGSKVKAGDSLCILEAMKMMNHLEAEFDCEISVVKAANGDLVEYGQVLFEVKRL
jgi:acetyl-CoA carboxylase biotin carboxyl carrier protein